MLGHLKHSVEGQLVKDYNAHTQINHIKYKRLEVNVAVDYRRPPPLEVRYYSLQ